MSDVSSADRRVGEPREHLGEISEISRPFGESSLLRLGQPSPCASHLSLTPDESSVGKRPTGYKECSRGSSFPKIDQLRQSRLSLSTVITQALSPGTRLIGRLPSIEPQLRRSITSSASEERNYFGKMEDPISPRHMLTNNLVESPARRTPRRSPGPLDHEPDIKKEKASQLDFERRAGQPPTRTGGKRP